MSSFTKVACDNVVDLDCAKKALKRMGIETRQNVKPRGYHQFGQAADLVAVMANRYDIGFMSRKEGGYDLVADWSMLGVNKTKWVGEFKQNYLREYDVKQFRRRGWNDIKETKDSKNVIHLECTVQSGGW